MLICESSDYSGLNKESGLILCFKIHAARVKSGSRSVSGEVEVEHDLVEVNLAVDGATECVLIQRITNLETLDTGDEALEELIIDVSVDEDSAGAETYLTLVEER